MKQERQSLMNVKRAKKRRLKKYEKGKHTSKCIPILLYNVYVRAVFTDDIAESRLLLDEEKTWVSPDNVAVCFKTEYGSGMFFLRAHVSAGTIAHECVHAVSQTFQRIGHSVDAIGQEVVTHFVGYLVEKTTEAWESDKEEIRKRGFIYPRDESLSAIYRL